MCQQVRNCIINLEMEARDGLLKKAISIISELKKMLPSLFTGVGRRIVRTGSLLRDAFKQRHETAHYGYLCFSSSPFSGTLHLLILQT